MLCKTHLLLTLSLLLATPLLATSPVRNTTPTIGFTTTTVRNITYNVRHATSPLDNSWSSSRSSSFLPRPSQQQNLTGNPTAANSTQRDRTSRSPTILPQDLDGFPSDTYILCTSNAFTQPALYVHDLSIAISALSLDCSNPSQNQIPRWEVWWWGTAQAYYCNYNGDHYKSCDGGEYQRAAGIWTKYCDEESGTGGGLWGAYIGSEGEGWAIGVDTTVNGGMRGECFGWVPDGGPDGGSDGGK